MTPSRARRDRYGRRLAIALVLSILVHVVVGAFFAIRSSGALSSNAPDASSSTIAETTTLETRRVTRDRTPATAAPKRVVHRVEPTAPPHPTRLRPIVAPAVAALAAAAARPVVHRFRGVPRKPELSKLSPTGSPAPVTIVIRKPKPSPEPTARALAVVASASPATAIPSRPPTAAPTLAPTLRATAAPTPPPSAAPTLPPTAAPTQPPTAIPTQRPTAAPTMPPTAAPTARPTLVPTRAPTAAPTARPTAVPTAAPTVAPTRHPEPTAQPRSVATSAPTALARATAVPLASPVATPGTARASAPSPEPRAEGSPGPRESSAAAASGGKTAASGGPASGPSTTSAAKAQASPAPVGTSASAPSAAASPASGASSSLDALNRRLNGLLPTGGDVAYDSKHFENPDLGAAISKAEAGYYEAAAPPPSVLAKAIKVVRQGSRQGGILTGPSAIVYILKRQRIFGLEVCTGWQILQTPYGPQGGYTIGSCAGESIVPSGGLPTLPPKQPSP